ncbi:hypothetical protein T492DRAFT_871778, partial [Pavlovales sp. CCMP2436]
MVAHARPDKPKRAFRAARRGGDERQLRALGALGKGSRLLALSLTTHCTSGMQRLVLRRCQQGRVGLLFVVLALMRCSADDTGSAPMLATASQPQSAAGSTGEAGYPPVRAAKPLSKATGKAHRRELLLLMWRRMLRVQALNPGLRLGLTEAPAAPPLLAPKRISMLYRDEFGYEVGGIDGIAFYHELTGTLCDVLGCGQMRPIYWFASSYADAPGCKRAAGGIPHESQVWFDLE